MSHTDVNGPSHNTHCFSLHLDGVGIWFARMTTWICLDYRHSQSTKWEFWEEKNTLEMCEEDFKRWNSTTFLIKWVALGNVIFWSFISWHFVALLHFNLCQITFHSEKLHAMFIAQNIRCHSNNTTSRKIRISNAMSWHQIILNALGTSRLNFELILSNIFSSNSSKSVCVPAQHKRMKQSKLLLNNCILQISSLKYCQMWQSFGAVCIAQILFNSIEYRNARYKTWNTVMISVSNATYSNLCANLRLSEETICLMCSLITL